MKKREGRHNYCKLIIKALFPRCLFLLHGLCCIWLLVKQEADNKFWYLSVCLFLLVVEGIFNALVRHGKEFHWFCPSAFLYCVVLSVTMSFLRERQIQCIINKSECKTSLQGNDILTLTFNKWSFPKRISLIEQTGLLVLIIGRWLLPSGSISREQFSQIVLIYIGTAADIVEFNEIYGNEASLADLKKMGDTRAVLHGVMGVWVWAVMQFSLTIALPEEGLKTEDEDDEEEDYQEISYLQKVKHNQVAPMSYMHYKSMLRQDYTSSIKRRELNGSKTENPPTRSRHAFREKHAQTSETLNSIRANAGLTNIHEENNSINAEETRSKTSLSRSSHQNSPSLASGDRFSLQSGNSSHSSSRNSYFITNGIGGGPPASISRVRAPSWSSVRSKDTSNDNQKTHKLSHESSEATKRKKSVWQRYFRPDKSKDRSRKDSIKEDNRLNIGRGELQSCFIKYLDLVGILLPICMQDGPFFTFRFVLIVRYSIVTEMIILLTVKNFLVIIVQIYRILLMYCSEPRGDVIRHDQGHDVEDASVRLRNAMHLNDKLSARLSMKRQKASVALTAVARMNMIRNIDGR